MNCPYCESNNIKVMHTKESVKNRIRRRRICCDCGERWSTLEVHADEIDNIAYYKHAFNEIDTVFENLRNVVKKWS